MWAYTDEEADWLQETRRNSQIQPSLDTSDSPLAKRDAMMRRNKRGRLRFRHKYRIFNNLSGIMHPLQCCNAKKHSPPIGILPYGGKKYLLQRKEAAMWPYHDEEAEWLDKPQDDTPARPSDDDIDNGDEFVPC
jgi:hypothetical protein